MKNQPTRAHLVRARGLGSAKDGTAHWWVQRLTAVALVPLTAWFMASLIVLTGRDQASFVAWLGSLVNTVLMLAFVIALFYHMALGLQVVVEDYVHTDRIKIPAVMAIQLGCTLLAITALVSIMRTIV